MDIMDSTDTPTGGLDGSTASSSQAAIPLSVDERDDFSSSTHSDEEAGTRATSTIRGDDPSTSTSTSTYASAFASMDAATGGDRIDDELPNGLPTSTDDVLMPRVSYTTHPSLLSHETDEGLLPRSPASSASSSASAQMERVKESAEDLATDAKAKASSMADSAKSGARSVMDSLSSTLHRAEDKAENAYAELKADVKAHMPDTHDQATPPRTTAAPEPTDTHPMAASMHDTHLHSGRVSLPTHDNEVRAKSVPHISEAHQRGLDDAAAVHAEPKDESASSGVRGALESFHQKLEDGADAIKDRVDAWAERNIRTTPKHGDHLSEAHVKDLPTLTDTSNERNTDYIRAKMHPASERAGVSAVQDNSV